MYQDEHPFTHMYSHTSQEGLNNARKLCQSLIDTVKKDYEQFKSSQSGPLGFGGGYSNSSELAPTDTF